MLDSGSNATLIHEDLAVQLGFSGQTQQLILSETNTGEKVGSFLIRNLTISGTGRRRIEYTIEKVPTVPQMNNPTYAVDWAAESRFEHLKDLDLKSVDAADVQLVIGVDSYFLQAPLDTHEGPRGTSIAIRTRLSWIAFATLPSDDVTDVYVRRIEPEPTTSVGTSRDFQWELEQWKLFHHREKRLKSVLGKTRKHWISYTLLRKCCHRVMPSRPEFCGETRTWCFQIIVKQPKLSSALLNVV